MSWAVEEWKDGLPAKALQKIQEIEGQLDKLKKERQQKQFQLDSLEATLQKQSILMNAIKFIRQGPQFSLGSKTKHTVISL
uniref:Centromere protein Cenp-F N-terminal domain-containing protein n=1 Tax=Sinocyclocheilus rhinocerous TaxID=307959 RepID=A0A673LQN1_9TELE